MDLVESPQGQKINEDESKNSDPVFEQNLEIETLEQKELLIHVDNQNFTDTQNQSQLIFQISMVLALSYIFEIIIAYILNILIKPDFFMTGLWIAISVISLLAIAIRFLRILWKFQILIFVLFVLLMTMLNVILNSAFGFVSSSLVTAISVMFVQIQIASELYAQPQLELKFSNFILSFVFGCSAILIMFQLDEYMWIRLLYLINPVISIIYPILYLHSLKQIKNGKFQLKNDQKYIGSILVMVNMIFFFIPN